jgi:hypothetical protein
MKKRQTGNSMVITEWDDKGSLRTSGFLYLIHKKIEWINRIMNYYPNAVFEGGIRFNSIRAVVDGRDFGEWRIKDDIGWVYHGRKNTWLK